MRAQNRLAIFSIFIFILPVIKLISQEKLMTERVNTFVDYYNEDKAESIFNMFNDQMAEALPLENTKQFLSQTKAQLGQIKNYTFVEYTDQNKNTAIYQVDFENGIFDLFFSLYGEEVSGLLIKPHKDRSVEVIKENTTEMRLPFKGKWYTVWGGDTKELNYHVVSDAQKNAFDFVMTDEKGKSFKNDGSKNEDYYCFGKELYAPCDAVVVMAVDGVRDNVPGEMNTSFPMGNTVILKSKDGKEYIYMCHFKQFSIKVKQGDTVKKGELLGLCGNSGRSSEAHLHFHLQNTDDDANATGIKCFFSDIYVNGEHETRHSPLQSEEVESKY